MANNISSNEFKERMKKVQDGIKARGLDGVIVHSDEADFGNVRYLSDYWPIFETAGIFIPDEGEPILLIGPESEDFAINRSQIKKIKKLIEYRESAEPDYPELKASDFTEVFSEGMNGRPINRLGIVGYNILPLSIYESIKKAIPEAEIIKADEVVVNLRLIKSPSEISLMKKAFHISELALNEILKKIKPGMTEYAVVGIAQKIMYENGAEYEGHPLYVLAGVNSKPGISRPSGRKIKKGEMIQLDIGARVGGYSSSVGRPICLGKMTEEMKRLVTVGLEAHKKTIEWIKPGVIAKNIVKKFYDFVKEKGCGKNLLYGPCHGIGMMEVEKPWMESHSDYPLEEGMTFQVDTFLQSSNFGLRWEDGVAVTKCGATLLCKKHMRILEL